MNRLTTMPKSRVIIAFTVALLIITLTVGSCFALRAYLRRRADQASQIHRRLDRELNNIKSPAGAIKVRHVDAFKGSHGNVGDYYKTSLSNDEIRAYYDRELETHGWNLKGESTLTTWGKDLGESLRTYCKDPIAANIYFTGKNESVLGFNYSLSISWRVVDECGN
jgi:hypothetical protein